MTVRVAIAGPLSGPRGAYGRLIANTVGSWMNRVGLQCTLFDDGASPPVAMSVADAIVKGRFEAVVGHFNSNCAMAVRPVYSAARVPLILPAATAPGLADGIHSFCLCADETYQVQRILEFARAYRRSPLYMWSDGTLYGERISACMEAMRGSGFLRIASLDEVDPISNGLVVCLGHCEKIMKAVGAHRRRLERSVLLCCDDCFIEDFIRVNHPSVFVCGPWMPFPDLLRRALEVVDSALVKKEAPIASLFDATGRYRGADFFVYRVHREGFRRVDDSIEPKGTGSRTTGVN